jgi:hypothetical protein
LEQQWKRATSNKQLDLKNRYRNGSVVLRRDATQHSSTAVPDE